MGVKASRRLLAMAVALVMIMTSAAAVFADSANQSEVQGSKQANKTVASISDGTLTVSGTVTKVTVNGVEKTAAGNTVSGLSEGDKVVVTTAQGESKRWMKNAKIKKATKKKVTWKKVKGASFYVVKYTKGGKTKYMKVKGTKLSKKQLKKVKGAKIAVRPITSDGFVGVWGAAKKVKKK